MELWNTFKTLVCTPAKKSLNIAVLNECCLQEKHFDALRACGTVTVYDDTDSYQKAVERLAGIDIAIADAAKISYNQQLFEQTPSLKLLVINTTGYDEVDVAAARQCGISVANAADYCSDAVAEHTMGLILAVVRKIPLCDRLQRENPFEVSHNRAANHCLLSHSLKGLTLGLIGLGRIGTLVAKFAQAFGMKIIAYDRSPKQVENITMVNSLEALLKEADVVSLHIPLLKETENLIGEKELAIMKPTAIIINTARGKLINTQALYHALKENIISGAGLDVLAEVDKSNPLLSLDNVVLTPHLAFYTEESCVNMADVLVNNVIAFTHGKPINIVN